MHGDTHYFKIDKPLPDATHMLANFTRVQTFGSPNVHWIKVNVDAASRNVFTFSPMIVAANAAEIAGSVISPHPCPGQHVRPGHLWQAILR